MKFAQVVHHINVQMVLTRLLQNPRVLQDLLCAGPFFRVHLQHPSNQVLPFEREVLEFLHFEIQLSRLNVGEELLQTGDFVTEGQLPSQNLIEDNPARPDVAFFVVVPIDYLWRYIERLCIMSVLTVPMIWFWFWPVTYFFAVPKSMILIGAFWSGLESIMFAGFRSLNLLCLQPVNDVLLMAVGKRR